MLPEKLFALDHCGVKCRYRLRKYLKLEIKILHVHNYKIINNYEKNIDQKKNFQLI